MEYNFSEDYLHDKYYTHGDMEYNFSEDYLHEESYTHGDMKQHNFLLRSEFNFILQQYGTEIAIFASSGGKEMQILVYQNDEQVGMIFI